MPAHNHGHVPIYHPVLDVVSYVSPSAVQVWERSGWQAGEKPKSRRRPAAPIADDPQTPVALAAGPDGTTPEPSPAPVKEN